MKIPNNHCVVQQRLIGIKRKIERNEKCHQALLEINMFKEELTIRETAVQKLSVELKEAAVQLEGLSQNEALLKGQRGMREVSKISGVR